MFELGEIVATRGIDEVYQKKRRFYIYILDCLFLRYSNADWGEMCEEDLKANDDALKNGGRLFASYEIPEDLRVDEHDKFWIITEWDRSVTTILFPEEY